MQMVQITMSHCDACKYYLKSFILSIIVKLWFIQYTHHKPSQIWLISPYSFEVACSKHKCNILPMNKKGIWNYDRDHQNLSLILLDKTFKETLLCVATSTTSIHPNKMISVAFFYFELNITRFNKTAFGEVIRRSKQAINYFVSFAYTISVKMFWPQ